MKLILLSFIAISLLAACSFVETLPGAEHIIFSNDENSCKKLGETEVAVLAEVLYMERDSQTIANELQTLAQNSAVKMGGNAIWEISDINEGRQSFSIFRCNPNK